MLCQSTMLNDFPLSGNLSILSSILVIYIGRSLRGPRALAGSSLEIELV